MWAGAGNADLTQQMALRSEDEELAQTTDCAILVETERRNVDVAVGAHGETLRPGGAVRQDSKDFCDSAVGILLAERGGCETNQQRKGNQDRLNPSFVGELHASSSHGKPPGQEMNGIGFRFRILVHFGKLALFSEVRTYALK